MSENRSESQNFLSQDAALAQEVFPSAVSAVKTGDVETLARLLLEHPALAYARCDGSTLLNHLASWPGHYPREAETGLALIRAGVEVNARAGDPEKGETALQWAASSDDVVLAELLLDAGTPVDGVGDDLRPLTQAIWYECPQVAALLVRRGATLDLELAAALGRMDRLATCFDADGRLQASACRHHHDPAKSPAQLLAEALCFAVYGGSIEAAQYLLDRGSEVNSAGWDGASPLHWAARGTVTAMVELLVERGADLSATDPKDRLTPLGWAERAKQQEMMELLKKLGAQ